MSRSGYIDDYDDDNWQMIRWRGAVSAAIRGKRGQAMLRELAAALDAMPDKRLIAHDLIREGEVCALGAVAQARHLPMADIEPEDYQCVAQTLGVAEALAREVMFWNDEGAYNETPERRWQRMRAWVAEQIRTEGA